MTQRLFPLLYINMGVEMMYVLDQRLRINRNSIEEIEKSDKALKDIAMSLLRKDILDTVFQTKAMPSRSILKEVYSKIANGGVMKLNDHSMDKLYDLMVMGTKFHLQQITMPEQIMTVTSNHLRGLLDIIPLDKDIANAVEHAYAMIFSVYRNLNHFQWTLMRCGLLKFFLGARVKVSMLLRASRQTSTGVFILHNRNGTVQMMKGGQPCGETRYFKSGQMTHTTNWEPYYKFTEFEEYPDKLDEPKKSTQLGVNVYKNAESLQIEGGGTAHSQPQLKSGDEMAFLENMLSNTVVQEVDASETFGISFFDNDEEEQTYVKESAEMVASVTRIDASAKKKSVKTAVSEKMSDSKDKPPTPGGDKPKPKKTKGASMLDMMDEAAARPPTAKPRAKRSDSAGGSAKPKSRAGSSTGARAPSAGAPKRATSAKRKPSS